MGERMTCDIIRLPCVTRGSDVTIDVALTDDGGAVDLTGRSLNVFDETRALNGRVSAEITDAEAGVITIHLEGTDPIAIGVAQFRVQINAPTNGGADSIGLPLFRLEVQ